jgi:hypothetical protein
VPDVTTTVPGDIVLDIFFTGNATGATAVGQISTNDASAAPAFPCIRSYPTFGGTVRILCGFNATEAAEGFAVIQKLMNAAGSTGTETTTGNSAAIWIAQRLVFKPLVGIMGATINTWPMENVGTFYPGSGTFTNLTVQDGSGNSKTSAARACRIRRLPGPRPARRWSASRRRAQIPRWRRSI